MRLGRWTALAVVGLACLGQAGCLGALLGFGGGARKAAAAMGQQVAYNLNRSLAGVDLPEAVPSADTLQSIERILEEHPDAHNRESLLRLRDRLERDVVETAAPAEAELARELPGAAYHPARDGAAGLAGLDRRAPDAGTGLANDLELEPVGGGRRLRSRDPWRFATPRQSSLPERRPDRPLIQIGPDRRVRYLGPDGWGR